MLSVETPTTYYTATRKYALKFDDLEQDLEAEVVVIGGGFSGINTVLELVERGVTDVVVLEARYLGFGGSGRNGGHVMAGIGPDPEKIGKSVGEEGLKAIFEISDLGASIIQSRIQRYQIDADFCHGYGYLGLNKRQGRLLQTWEKEYKQLNPEHEIAYLEGAKVRSIVGSDVYSCALKHVVSRVIADGMTSGSRHWDVMSAIPRTRIPGKDHWRNLICTLGKASHQLAGYRNGRR